MITPPSGNSLNLSYFRDRKQVLRLDTLYQQNHCGVYRSDNGGQDWRDITEGLPSRFGFVLGIHSQDPDTIYVLPEDQVLGTDVGGLRYVTEAKFRVYRSRDGGESWEALTNGLPQKGAYLHALREGMATDHLDPCGIYLGTTTGQLFYSLNDGDSWELLLEHLPPINSVGLCRHRLEGVCDPSPSVYIEVIGLLVQGV